MKKILALVLAVVMAMGLASVALAADPVLTVEKATAQLYKYNSTTQVGEAKGLVDGYTDTLVPAGVYYISIAADVVNDTSLAATTIIDKNVASKYKVFGEWTVGKLEDMKLEYKKIQLLDAAGNVTGEGYAYVISFTIPETDSVSKIDIVGDLKVAKTASAAKSLDGVKLATNYGYGEEPLGSGASTVDITNTSYATPIIKFHADNTDMDITWGDDVALFTVNVAGQGKLNLAYSVSYNTAFGNKYDYANIDFVTFKKAPAFNRTGELYIYAEEGTFIYEVAANNTAKAIANAVYDEDYGAWKIKTRKLGSYAISDKELKLEAASSSEAPVSSTPTAPTEGGKANPNTGR